MPLEATLAVPVGLAVPDEDERGRHLDTLAARWNWDSAASEAS
jgi:hypothetical protein